jgi:hypothetical protein
MKPLKWLLKSPKKFSAGSRRLRKVAHKRVRHLLTKRQDQPRCGAPQRGFFLRARHSPYFRHSPLAR